jgi:hypothetical protein
MTTKFLPGGATVNFCTSGSCHCDVRCRHHPESIAPSATRSCYAIATERYRVGLAAKLRRHEQMDPALLIRRATLEVQRRIARNKRIPWLRISSSGSVPHPIEASQNFLNHFRILLAFCQEHNIPVHFPVESQEKAAFYHAEVGHLVVVRETAQTLTDFLTSQTPVSFTAGEKHQNRKQRLETSHRIAKARKELTGRHTLACPAIARFFSTNRAHPKFKCGVCKACAMANFDVVYPIH